VIILQFLLKKELKILSYNVNGIRAALNKDLDKWIEITDHDILCLQETKVIDDSFPILHHAECVNVITLRTVSHCNNQINKT